MKGSDGQPGQMVLYYQSLATTTRQDIVFTAAHETCHYLFGLADDTTTATSPTAAAPPRPGLPDGQLPAGMRGFMGKLCDGEHDRRTPAEVVQGPGGRLFRGPRRHRHRQGPERHPVRADPADRHRRRHQPDRAAAATKVQSRRSGSLGSSVAAGLRSIAGKTLKTLIEEYNRNNPSKLIFTAQQLKVATDLISKAGSLLPTERPAGLSPENYASLKAEAQRLGSSPEIQAKKTDSSRFSAIRTGLRAFMRQLIKADGGAAGSTRPSRPPWSSGWPAMRRSPADKTLDRLVSVTDVQAELSLVAAENILRVLDEMDAPGIPRQLEILGGFRKRFEDLSIPGRTSAGFGLRRTRFITPDPPAEFSIVLTQGGVVSYPYIRDRGFMDFSRLIDRARIELVRPSFDNASRTPLNPRIDRPFEAIPEAQIQEMRDRNNSDLQAFLNEILNQLQRNRLENIGVLVPPAACPPRSAG